MILQIANEPVLPFNALDVALEVQNSLKGNFSLNYSNFSKWKIVQLIFNEQWIKSYAILLTMTTQASLPGEDYHEKGLEEIWLPCQ